VKSGSCFRPVPNRHLTTRLLAVPADIQGGDAVAEETPSGLNDAVTVRTSESVRRIEMVKASDYHRRG